MYSYLIKKLIMPFISTLTPYKGWRYYQQFLKSEYDSSEIWQKLQWERLKNIIHHAYNNTSFYRDKFDKAGIKPKDIKTRDDFLRVPVTTKRELRQNFPDKIIAINYKNKILRYSNTSGTTGRPLMLAQDLDDVNYKYAAKLRSRKLYGTDIGESVLRITPNECQPCLKSGDVPENIMGYILNKKNSAYYMFLEKKIINPFFHHRLMLSPMGKKKTDMADKDFYYYINAINYYRPDILIGYPLYLYWLAKFMVRKNINPPDIGIIDLTAGLSTENLRNFISKVFKAKVYQCYGGCEFSRYASECKINSGLMHILEDFCYIEFIKPDGNLANSGQLANIVVTSLTNYAMPIIRLEPGDVGYYDDRPCVCGRTTRLMDVEGRIQGVVVTNDNKIYPASYFWDKFLFLKGIKYFQLIQHQENNIELKIVKENIKTKLNEKEIINELKEVFGRRSKISINYVKYILSEHSGKYQLVKSCSFNKFRPISIRRNKTVIN